MCQGKPLSCCTFFCSTTEDCAHRVLQRLQMAPRATTPARYEKVMATHGAGWVSRGGGAGPPGGAPRTTTGTRWFHRCGGSRSCASNSTSSSTGGSPSTPAASSTSSYKRVDANPLMEEGRSCGLAIRASAFEPWGLCGCFTLRGRVLLRVTPATHLFGNDPTFLSGPPWEEPSLLAPCAG